MSKKENMKTEQTMSCGIFRNGKEINFTPNEMKLLWEMFQIQDARNIIDTQEDCITNADELRDNEDFLLELYEIYESRLYEDDSDNERYALNQMGDRIKWL